VPAVCGPVEYKLYRTNEEMTDKNELLEFVKYDNITYEIDIQSFN
jgi:hypothetical protein